MLRSTRPHLWLRFAFLAGWCGMPWQPSPLQAVEESLTDRLRSAIEFQMDGDQHYSDLLFEHVLRESPHEPLVHWRRGEVRVGGDWVPINTSEAWQPRPAWWAVYEQLRTAATANPATELQLAGWCAGQGDAELARVHYRRVLERRESDESQRASAAAALGLEWVGGQWRTRQEARDWEAAQAAAREDLVVWTRRLEQWKKAFSRNLAAREKACREMRDELTEAALPALEWSSREPSAWTEWAIDLIASLPGAAASESLARYAMAAPDEAARQRAAERLRSRPPSEFVPLMLAALENPLLTDFQIIPGERGSVLHRQLFVREGVDEIVEAEMRTLGVTVGRRAPTRPMALTDAVQRAATTQAEVAASNARTFRQNALVYAALAGSTEATSIESTPNAWWDWWKHYNDYEVIDYKPSRRIEQERVVSYFDPVANLPGTFVSGGECFPAGTLVWTAQGKRPVEQIQIGERVLAQDVETGQLLYQPVSDVTVRIANTVLVTAEAHQVRSTLGHPFWVERTGWRMARKLEPGDRLHTVRGSLCVDTVERAGATEVYNLSVANCATYFVGDEGLLVHDSSFREPANVDSPGLPRVTAESVPVADAAP